MGRYGRGPVPGRVAVRLPPPGAGPRRGARINLHWRILKPAFRLHRWPSRGPTLGRVRLWSLSEVSMSTPGWGYDGLGEDGLDGYSLDGYSLDGYSEEEPAKRRIGWRTIAVTVAAVLALGAVTFLGSLA